MASTSKEGEISKTPKRRKMSDERDKSAKKKNQKTEPSFPLDKFGVFNENCLKGHYYPMDELDDLLQASIDLCKKNIDNENCRAFYEKGLPVFFNEILTEDSDKYCNATIKDYFYRKCEKVIELCVLTLKADCSPLLKLLSKLLHPKCSLRSLHPVNAYDSRRMNSNDTVYAITSPDRTAKSPQLVDLINRFGELNGFKILRERFEKRSDVAWSLTWALLKPFQQCFEYLTSCTVSDYFVPIVENIIQRLDGVSNNDLLSETSSALPLLTFMCRVLEEAPESQTKWEFLNLKLKINLRLFEISPDGSARMKILKEINTLLGKLTNRLTGKRGLRLSKNPKFGEINGETIAKSFKDCQIVCILMRDLINMVDLFEDLKTFLNFIAEISAFAPEDLDAILVAREGENASVDEKIRALLENLARNLPSHQIELLFPCIISSWFNGSNGKRKELLTFIECLLEIDKIDVPNDYFWNMVFCDGNSAEVIDQTLKTFAKIIKQSALQEENDIKEFWLIKCIEQLQSNGKFVLPTLKLMREIFDLYEELANNESRIKDVTYRIDVIEHLVGNHDLLTLICKSLVEYIDSIRGVNDPLLLDPSTFCPDNKYCHNLQLEERLNFLCYVLKEGRIISIEAEKMELIKIHEKLLEDPMFPSDKEIGFKWLLQFMSEFPRVAPSFAEKVFVETILKLDPSGMTEIEFNCFSMIFKALRKYGNQLPRDTLNELRMSGTEFLWTIIKKSDRKFIEEATDLVRMEYSYSSPDDDHIAKIVECPVCYQRLDPPVDSCTRGHSVCNVCRPDVRTCPICRSDFLPEKNSLLNDLIRSTNLSCKNKERGCAECLPISELPEHEKLCDYRLVVCFCRDERNFIPINLSKHFSEHGDVVKINPLEWTSFNIEKNEGNNVFRTLYAESLGLYFVLRCVMNWEGRSYILISYVDKLKYKRKFVYSVKIKQEHLFLADCYFNSHGLCSPYRETERELVENSEVIGFEMSTVLSNKDQTNLKIEIKIQPAV